MSARSFACGESLCKRSFEAALSPEKPWPLKCPACGRSLYPDDILQTSALENLDQFRGPLMRVLDGRLVPVVSADLVGAGTPAPASLLDEILEAKATEVAPTRPPRTTAEVNDGDDLAARPAPGSSGALGPRPRAAITSRSSINARAVAIAAVLVVMAVLLVIFLSR